MKHLGVSTMILALGTTLMAAPQSTSHPTQAPAATTQTKTHKKAHTKKVKNTKTTKATKPAPAAKQ